MAVLPIGIGSAAGAGGYQIERSLRFNSADSAYLSRTPASTGSQTAWTWSGWVKRSTIATSREFIYAINNSNRISWSNSDSSQQLVFEVYNGAGADYFIQTTPVYRDPSAWYHIVAVWDSNNGTTADRQRIYVNGVRITAFSATGNTVPSGATSNNWNTTSANNIGRSPIAGEYFSGYLTELYFIDGQALTPSSFGRNNVETGVWEPLAYTGTYGTNGFYLNFSDNSGTTSTTLGKDSSGNGNNWTPNNFSVTAGVGNDSLVDSPTSYGTDTGAGGEVRGNYVTLNPLNKNTSGTLSNGNLEWQASTTAVQVVTGTSTIIPSGKTYFELNVVTAAGSGTYFQVGIAPPGKSLTSAIGNASGNGYSIEQNQADDIQLRLNGTSTTISTVVQTGDVLQVAVDYATGKLWFGRNNTWYNSSGGTTGNPAAGTNETATISTTTDWFPAVAKYNTGGSYAINFGQRAFAYTAPSGFKALCTQNLPTPTIGATSTTQAGKYFNTKLWTGNGSTQSITGIGFQPDLVWTKDRGAAFDHTLFDAVRGATKFLRSNATTAEETRTDSLTSFDSDGFSVGADAVRNNINKSSASYVSWAWDANGAGSSNTAGTITSTVSANTTSGFSIVTYTGNGSANQTVGHGLGVAPAFGILKDRDVNSNNDQWQVFHTGAGDKYAYLSTTAAFAGTAEFYPTSGSSTTVTVGRGSPVATTNESGDRFVMYLFAPVAGYSAFGSYTGNGSTDGPFVYTGFRPRFVMVKQATVSARDWIILDTSRNTYNVADLQLMPNKSDAEATTVLSSTAYLDFVSNGFKVRNTSVRNNENTATYIYAAFAESPFKYSLAR